LWSQNPFSLLIRFLQCHLLFSLQPKCCIERQDFRKVWHEWPMSTPVIRSQQAYPWGKEACPHRPSVAHRVHPPAYLSPFLLLDLSHLARYKFIQLSRGWDHSSKGCLLTGVTGKTSGLFNTGPSLWISWRREGKEAILLGYPWVFTRRQRRDSFPLWKNCTTCRNFIDYMRISDRWFRFWSWQSH